MFGKPFWDNFFQSAKELGLRPRRLLLIGLAVVTMIGMILGVHPIAAILFLIVAYCLDPALKFAKSMQDNRNKSNDRTVVATNFQKKLQQRRKQLRADQPELPLPAPQKRPEEPT